MSRITRRLVAGTVLAGALVALAPQAQATQGCFVIKNPVTGQYMIVCTR